MHWQTSRYSIDLGRPMVMGIVNATPDSFSDGGQHALSHAAMAHGDRLVGEGVDILDIGGESTRPGSRALSDGEEMVRVLPVVRHAVTLGRPVSVDTSSVAVMRPCWTSAPTWSTTCAHCSGPARWRCWQPTHGRVCA